MGSKLNCIFSSEEDCPKDYVALTCEECLLNKYYLVIERALKDFVTLGDSFTAIFQLCEKMLNNHNKQIKVEVPVESINNANRVINALLGMDEALIGEEKLYRRLIFYFFEIIIDEFKENEYTEDGLKH